MASFLNPVQNSMDDDQGSSLPFFESMIYFFKIPQWRTEVHQARSWNLKAFDVGFIKLYSTVGRHCCILKFRKETDMNTSGESRFYEFPSSNLKPVADSNRYFVLNILWTETGKREDIGICFVQRAESKQFLSSIMERLKASSDRLSTIVDETESESASSTKSSCVKSVQGFEVKSYQGTSNSCVTASEIDGLESQFSKLKTSKESYNKEELTNGTEQIPISDSQQSISVAPRVHFQKSEALQSYNDQENMQFFDTYYPELRILTNDFSQIRSSALQELRRMAPKQVIRPGLKKQEC